jgi:prolyl oligopeptidase
LYAYSPYHHVVEGTHYPPTLFLTGENDGRVNPAHSRKMIARLQAANASDGPILLRTSATSGHGLDSTLNEQIAEDADEYAFLLDQLKVNYKPPVSS